MKLDCYNSLVVGLMNLANDSLKVVMVYSVVIGDRFQSYYIMKSTLLPFACILLFSAGTGQTQTISSQTMLISAGVGSLENGSIVNIGQPLVGLTYAGTTIKTGIIPELLASTPKINLLRLSPEALFNGSQISLTLFGEPGKSYILQASTNLISWESLITNLAYGVSLQFDQTNASSMNYRFYRVLEQ